MAQHASARKQMRQSLKSRARNRKNVSQIKTQVKKLRAAIAAGDAAAAKKLLPETVGEIDKLEAWAGGERTLTAEDVAAVSGRGLARPLYRLGDAIAERDPAAALAFIQELLENGEEGPLILGTLHRSLRQMRALLAMREKRVPRDEMAARLLPGNMAFKLPSLLEASQRWSEAELGRALRALAAADRRLKTGSDARVALLAVVGELRPSPRPGR